MSIVDCFMKAVAQLPDPRLRRVMLIGIAGSLAIFIALWLLLWWAMGAVQWTEIWLIGGLIEWLGSFAEWIGGVLYVSSILLATFLLFPGVVTVIVSFFLEEVVGAVEAKHYPGEPTPRPQPLSEMLSSTVRFALTVVALNLLFLPLYLILLFLPPLNLILYYLLNGHLISREFYELVALRRMDPATAKRLRKAHGGRLLFAGVLLALLMTIPIVNFITPVLGAAFMVHVYQNLPKRREIAGSAGGPPANRA
jgi:CysZ protein